MKLKVKSRCVHLFIQKKFQEETTEVDSEYEEEAVRKAFWVSICLRGRF